MKQQSVSGARLWLFRLIALVLVPLIFVLALEAGLRLFRVGHDVGFTTACKVDGQPSLCENPRFIERFFPPDIARQPVSFAYSQVKSERTFRVFILGASAAQGDPEYSYGFSRILRVMLEEIYPTLHFEIINTAISATNSHVVLPIAQEIRQHDPDLAIVYLGNNEVVGPFGAGTVFAPIAGSRALIRTGIALKTTRLGQLLDRVATGMAGHTTPGEWRGMEMFIDNQVRHDSAELQTVYRHYQDNLADILQVFSDQETPVLLSTVGSNLKDFPPLEAQHRPDLAAAERDRWNADYEQGRQLLHAGDPQAALTALQRAARLDDQHAELQYLLGRGYLALADPATAREHFVRARDLDTLRFRADSRVNAIVRSLAERFADRGVDLVDAVALFDRASPAGIAGNELFYEHVHLTFAGNYRLARTMAERVQDILGRGDSGLQPAAELPGQEECAELLALGPYDRLRLRELVLSRMKAPPFTGQLGAQERVDRLRQEYDRLKDSLTPAALRKTDALYRRAIQSSPNDPTLKLNYGVFLKDQKRHSAALAQFRTAAQLLPRSYKVQRYLSDTYVALGRWEASLPHFQASLELTRSTTDRTAIRIMKAYAQARLERYAASMETYRNALDEDPSAAAELYHAMARLQMNIGALEPARDYLEQALAEQQAGQEAADIYFNYGHVLRRLERPQGAVKAFGQALALYREQLDKVTQPADRESLLVVLGRSAFAVGDIDQGSVYLRQAIELNPLSVNHRLTLATGLARQGRVEDARTVLEQAIEAMRAAGQADAVRQLQSFRRQLR